MLKTSLVEFKEQLHMLRNHFEVYEKHQFLVKEIIAKPSQVLSAAENDYIKLYNKNSTHERQLEYISNIVYLYSSLERFVENIIEEYVREINLLYPDFNNVNEKLHDYYLSNLMKLYDKSHYAKFSKCTIEKIAANLHDVVIENKCVMMGECFLPNAGNYTHRKIREALEKFNIQDLSQSLSNCEPLKTFLLEHDKEISSDKFEAIDVVTDRRNEVAHKGGVSDILTHSYLNDYSIAIEKYSESLVTILNDSLLRTKWEVLKKQGHMIYAKNNYFSIIDVYSFNSANARLKVGMKALVLLSNNSVPSMFELKVDSIHQDINGKTEIVDEINEKDVTVFSVHFDSKVIGIKKCMFFD